MKISFHVIEHKIEIFVVFCFNDVEQTNNILVPIEFLQEHHFPEGSLSIC
jgi:hypothetical protein